MNSHHPLLSIVPILLTSPAWADLCANPHSCVGQKVSSGISSCSVQSGLNNTNDVNPCRVGYCLGQEDAAIGQAVAECGDGNVGRLTSSLCRDDYMGAYRWMCILTALHQSQIDVNVYAQTQPTFCHHIGIISTSWGVPQMACPANISIGQIPMP